MKKKSLILSLCLAASLLPSLAVAENKDENLIEIATANSEGYDSFNSYVLKNSIKKLKSGSTTFNLLLTGVSTTETTQNNDTTPIPMEEKLDEYDLDDSRVILNISMDCKTQKSKVEKILSIDPATGKLKENVNTETEDDPEMNKALSSVVCY